MKDGAKAKDEAENKRIFYVGATRSKRPSNSIGFKKHLMKNQTSMLKWLCMKLLDISDNDDSLSKQVNTNRVFQ